MYPRALKLLRVLQGMLQTAVLISLCDYIQARTELFGFINTNQGTFRHKASATTVFIAFMSVVGLLTCFGYYYFYFRHKSSEAVSELVTSKDKSNLSLVMSFILMILWLLAWTTMIPECLQQSDVDRRIRDIGIPGFPAGTRQSNLALGHSSSAISSCNSAVILSSFTSIAYFASLVLLAIRYRVQVSME